MQRESARKLGSTVQMGAEKSRRLQFEIFPKNAAIRLLAWVVVSLTFLPGAWGGGSPTGAVKETVDQVFVVHPRHDFLPDIAALCEAHAP